MKREVVAGSHGIKTIADCLLEEIEPSSYDMVILPGGLPGADTLRDNDKVIAWVQKFISDPNKYVAAICAAPQVLAKAGVVSGRTLTSYPGEKYIGFLSEANYIDDNSKMQECVMVSLCFDWSNKHMKHCMECGIKLLMRYHEGEKREIPFCPECNACRIKRI